MHLSKKRTFKDQNRSDKLTGILLIIYIMVLFWILLFKLGVHFSYMSTRSINLIPFDRLFLSNTKVDKSELILNVVIFAPLGIYFGILFKKWNWQYKLLTFALLSFIFEMLQFIFRIGAFDTTDIITNTLGGLIGLLLSVVIEKIFNNEAKSQNLINAVAAIGTVTIITLLALLKLNMLPIKYQ